jgi:hypothetical protein
MKWQVWHRSMSMSMSISARRWLDWRPGGYTAASSWFEHRIHSRSGHLWRVYRSSELNSLLSSLAFRRFPAFHSTSHLSNDVFLSRKPVQHHCTLLSAAQSYPSIHPFHPCLYPIPSLPFATLYPSNSSLPPPAILTGLGLSMCIERMLGIRAEKAILVLL